MNATADSSSPGPMRVDLQRTFEAAPALLLVIAPDRPRFTILAATDAYLRATKTRRSEIVGRALFEVFPDNPDDPRTTANRNTRASLERAIERRLPDAMPVQRHDIRRPEAEGGGFEERYWSPVNAPVLDESGVVIYIIHQVEDVTEVARLEQSGVKQQVVAQTLQAATKELRDSRRAAINLMEDAVAARRQAEQVSKNLNQSREDLDRAQAVAQIGSWRLDVRRNVLTWSAETHRIFGVPQGTPMTYETFVEKIHPDDRPYVDTQWKAAMAGAPYDIEHRIVVDGQIKWVREKAYLEFDDAGALLAGFGIAQDVTERKLAEEALRESREQLRKANEELEERVCVRTAELSHANAILLQRGAQLRALASELTLAEQRERRRMAEILHDHLQQILVGAQFQLTALARTAEPQTEKSIKKVGDLLSESVGVCRNLTGELCPPILYSGGLAQALKWLIRWVADKHGLTVDLQCDDDPPVPDAEDVKVLLFQSARELLFNVVKHARISSARMIVKRSHGQIEVTVEDKGEGFDPEQSFPREGAAGGFGLFSIRERLELLGGSMHIRSAPEHGSCFTLRAPATMAAVPQDALIHPVAGASCAPGADSILPKEETMCKIRVLLVDDHAVIRKSFSQLIQDEPDMEVVGMASDGAEARSLVKCLRPDVVLMDVTMPNMNGVEATRHILAESPTVSVIGMSMFEKTDFAEQMLKAGASAYLTKSDEPEKIIQAIRETAAKRNPAS